MLLTGFMRRSQGVSGLGQGEPRAASALPGGLLAPLGSRSRLCQAGWPPPAVGLWPCSEVLCVRAGAHSEAVSGFKRWACG